MSFRRLVYWIFNDARFANSCEYLVVLLPFVFKQAETAVTL